MVLLDRTFAGTGMPLPTATESALAWFVREPWPSPSTGADLFAGRLDGGR
jgi:hypothetical protein